jgi:hypothetical protein
MSKTRHIVWISQGGFNHARVKVTKVRTTVCKEEK